MDWNYLLSILSSDKTNKAVDTILKLSSLFALGALSFSFWNWLLRPKLLIRPMKVGSWKYKDTGWERDAVTVEIKNKRNRKALGAKAIISLLTKPNEAKILEKERDLHWAGTNYCPSTTSEYTIDIGATPQRLDVFFTHKGTTEIGCWLGTSWALLDIPAKDQFYMPPGNYEFDLRVVCENGKGETKRYLFKSPDFGEQLTKPEEIRN